MPRMPSERLNYHSEKAAEDIFVTSEQKAQAALLKYLEEHDPVNQPAHYKHNPHGIECIDAIKACLSKEEYEGYLRGNVMKYNWRCRYKNGVEDLKKAQWYVAKLIESLQEEAQ